MHRQDSDTIEGTHKPGLASGRSVRFWWTGLALSLLLAELIARIALATAVAEPVRWYDAAAQQRVEMMDQLGDSQVDTVFAGTSMAWQAFVPDVFDARRPGQRSFNVGLAGAIPTVSERWLTDVVEDKLRPDTVVWGLSSLDLSDTYGDDAFDAWDSSPGAQTGVLGRMDSWLSARSAFFRLRRDLRRPGNLWGPAATARADLIAAAGATTGADGERLDFAVDRTPTNAAIQRARLQNFRIDLDDLRAIERAVGELQAQGTRVVLVELPVPPSFVALHPRGAQDHELVGLALQLLADDLGAEYYDLSGGYSDQDFVDFNHLSAEAAARFSAEASAAIPLERPQRDRSGT